MPLSHSSRLAFGAVAGAALCVGLLAGPSLASSRPAGRAVPDSTPTPQPYPLVNGYSDAYNYTIAYTIQYAGQTPSPATTYTGSQTDLDQCPVTFNGITNLCDDVLIDSDGSNSGNYEGYAGTPSGSTPLVSYGAYALYENFPYTEAVTFVDTPYEIYYLFPLSPGQQFDEYNFTLALTDLTYGPKNYLRSSTEAQDPSGAYKYVTKENDPASHYVEHQLQQVDADGSATETLTQTGYNKLTESFGTPQSRGGREVIAVTTEGGNARPATPEPKRTTYVPDWFPGGGAAPSPLQNEPTTYIGVQTLPAACGNYAGTQAGDEQSLYTDLDPLFGSVASAQFDNYLVEGTGEVCETETYVLSYYDNLVSGSLLYTETYVESYVLNSQYIPQGRARQRGWPPALPHLERRAPPSPELADAIRRFHGRHSPHGLHLRPQYRGFPAAR
jgi:hypothetical protein